MRSGWLAFVLLVVCLAGFSNARAEEESLSSLPDIHGYVVDPQGQPIADVRVKAIAASGKARFVTRTDSGGRYFLPDLSLGEYEVVIESKNFKRKTFAKVILGTSHNIELNAKLDVADGGGLNVQPDPDASFAPPLDPDEAAVISIRVSTSQKPRRSIDVRISATNVSGHDREFGITENRPRWADNFSIMIKDQKGYPAKETQLAIETKSIVGTAILVPWERGKTITDTVEPGKLYELTAGEQYWMSVIMRGPSGVIVSSNRVNFTVPR